MAQQGITVEIEGLRAFRQALKEAEGATPRELTNGLKQAGAILPDKIRPGMGSVSAKVGRPTASGTKARIPVRHRAAAIAEFSNKGRYGATMNARYGRTPRYGYRAVDDHADQLTDRLYDALESIATVHGWFD